MITKTQNTDCVDLSWDNGVYLGYCYRGVDGYYVFVFKDDLSGAWTEESLMAIANTLIELNKEWDEKVKAIPPVIEK